MGLTLEALGARMGTDKTTVSKLEAGKRKMTSDWMTRIALAMKIEPQQLMALPPEDAPEAREIERGPFAVSVGEYTTRPIAGGGSSGDGELLNRHWGFPMDFVRRDLRANPSDLAILTIVGDSMAGTVEPGDKVLVDRGQVDPSPPGVFVLWDGVGLVAKRLEYVPNSEPPTVRVLSDNPHYATYERASSEIEIRGRIVGRWQRM